MPEQTQVESVRVRSRPFSRGSWVTGAGLALLAGILILLRLHTYDEPLERDITTYAVIAHELLDGRALYTDMWDHKPPAVHATFALAELITGYGRRSIFLLNIAAGLTTLCACYLAGSAQGRGRWTGLLAAAIWTLVSGDLTLEGNQPNTEVFINACTALGLALMLRGNPGSLGLTKALGIGVLFALGSLYKQIVIINVALLIGVWLATAPRTLRWRALKESAIVTVVGVLAWTAVFAYFALTGRWASFFEAAFTYNREYAGDFATNLRDGIGAPLHAKFLLLLVPLALCTFVGAFLGFRREARVQWVLLLALLAGTQFTVSLTGHFFPHYYQLFLPALVIGSAWAISALPRTSAAWLPQAAAGAMLAGLVCLEAPFYFLSAQEWSLRKYGSVFLLTEQLARRLDKVLPPGATLFEWGSETGFYFETQRRPPTGVIFVYPLVYKPLVPDLIDRSLRDLEKNRPELIILDKKATEDTPPFHPFASWFYENYHSYLKAPYGPFRVFIRNDSQLQAAL